jgi:hypothetical protein
LLHPMFDYETPSGCDLLTQYLMCNSIMNELLPYSPFAVIGTMVSPKTL